MLVLGAPNAESAVASAGGMLQLQFADVLAGTDIAAAIILLFYADNLKELLLLLLRCPIARH